MRCKICASNKVHVIYNGVIRNGGVGRYTSFSVPMYQCDDCGVIWHEDVLKDLSGYYESPEYREVMDEGSSAEVFYANHDRETLDKFLYTGTDIFRNKAVADIGCGGGAFLDFLNGVARNIIAIEPSEAFQKVLREKGYSVYPYARDAMRDWAGRTDVVVSFDVIEHVEDPVMFLKDAFDLLKEGGTAVIGTPTDAPVMRSLLGECYEKQVLFSVQHLWILSEKSLRLMAATADFRDIEVRYFQRYGIDNVLAWCLEKRPGVHIEVPFFKNEMNAVWRGTCSGHSAADYIVLYVRK